jgi:hypothetical protein
MGERLFLSFSQEAALVPSQWWEGRLEYADGKDNFPDVFLARAVLAFRPIKNLVVGGNVGFGSSKAASGLPDGSGATDMDLYGKWVFPQVAADTDMTAGLLLTIPTGDDTAGMGFNSFASQLFGGVRYHTESMIIAGHLGVRYNGDGSFQGVDYSGRMSFQLGGSVVFPLANHVSIVAETALETDRFDDIDASTELLFGVNWKAFSKGMFRGAISGGLTGGAPNFRVILGYAASF